MSQTELTADRGSKVQIVTSERHFEWPAAVKKQIKDIIKKYPAGKQASAVIPTLMLAQKTFDGWLPVELMDLVAETLDMPAIRVYEVASFYDMFFTEPVGKHVVRMCTNVSCLVCGADKVLEAMEETLGIKAGQTTADGMVTLQEFECLGACCQAPMMMLDDHYHVNLTPASAVELMRQVKAGNAPAAFSDSKVAAPAAAPKKAPAKTTKAKATTSKKGAK